MFMYVNPSHAQELTGQFDRKRTPLSISLYFGDRFLKRYSMEVNLVWSRPASADFACFPVPFDHLPLQEDVLKIYVNKN